MRVNVYAEEMTDRIEIIEKEVEGQKFTALRLYLELPASYIPARSGERYRSERPASVDDKEQAVHYKAPFIHRPGDDDSSAVTFWGKRDLRAVLRKMIAALDAHYRRASSSVPPREVCHWKISSRRGKPCVEGTSSDGAMIHLYLQSYDVATGLAVDAETGEELRLV